MTSPPVGWGGNGGDTPTQVHQVVHMEHLEVVEDPRQVNLVHKVVVVMEDMEVAFTWMPTQKGSSGPNSSARYFGGGGGGSSFSNNGPAGGGRSGGGAGGKGPGHAADGDC